MDVDRRKAMSGETAQEGAEHETEFTSSDVITIGRFEVCLT